MPALLLRQVRIVAPTQPDIHGQIRDILIRNGKIQHIAPHISLDTTHRTPVRSGESGVIAQNEPDALTIFDKPNTYVSYGWLDIGVQIGDPGLEHREDLNSVARAAMAGGYTTLAPFPNTEPAIHSKSEVLYIKNKTQAELVDFQPIGALSVDCKGKDMAEMLDMRAAGAVAFSDGAKSVQDAGLILRGLQYARIFDGLIINMPHDKTIAAQGQMHEGEVSTALGLTGLPAMAEELAIQRDLQLLEYTGGRLHFQNISTAKAVDLIRAAKRRGQNVTASVAALNLCFTDAILRGFDTQFKLMPPLREESDRRALIAGLQDGTIDFISTNHTPIDEEGKNLEFPYADFGAIGLETTFGLVNHYCHQDFSIEALVALLGLNAYQLFHLETQILEGATANLTLFNPETIWTFSEKDIRSKSKNTGLVGHILRGQVLGVINKGRFQVE